MKWTNPGHQYDHMKDIILEENVQYYIWGAAVRGTALYHSMKNEINIVGFIDSNPNKHGLMIGNVKIYDPSVLNNQQDKTRVIVATGWERQVFAVLREKGFTSEKNCFLQSIFTPLFYYFKYNQIAITQLAYIITERCTLKCRGCGSYIPYVSEPKDIEVQKILEGLEHLFRHVDKLSLFTISGGDALLHRDIDVLIDTLCEKYYKTKIDCFSLLTNGIVIPKQRTLELLKKNEVIVRITNYTDNAVGQNIEKLKKLLTENDIPFELITHEYWTDTGYPQESNGLVNENQWIRLYQECGISCATLSGTKLFSCGRTIITDRIGYCPFDSQDYIELSTLETKEKIRIFEFMSGYCEKGYIELCKKCNGSIRCSDKIIPVGEQIQK